MDTKHIEKELSELNSLFNQLKELRKINKKKSRKMLGHLLYNKSMQPGFVFPEILIGSSAYNAVAFYLCHISGANPWLYMSLGTILFGTALYGVNVLIHYINNTKATGPIGRTYAMMGFYSRVKVLLKQIKKNKKYLLNPKMINQKTIKKLQDINEWLDIFSEYMNNTYQSMSESCQYLSEKKQKKWMPLIDEMRCYAKYFKMNAEKFNKLTNLSVAEYNDELTFECEMENRPKRVEVIDNLNNISDFEQFKSYLLRKKEQKANNSDIQSQKHKFDINTEYQTDEYSL